MAITETDVEMYAARIRAHFPPELRETAFALALSIARLVGPKTKQLRPETTLDEIIEWLGPQYVIRAKIPWIRSKWSWPWRKILVTPSCYQTSWLHGPTQTPSPI